MRGYWVAEKKNKDIVTCLKEEEAHQKTTKASLKCVETKKNQEVKTLKKELLLEKKH